LCSELEARGIPPSVQHDDLHLTNVYKDGDRLRVLDWGDACIAHPFMSLVDTFRFLEEVNELRPDDPWFERLRDVYLEPWGSGHRETFELALRVGMIAHPIAWVRQRRSVPDPAVADFDIGFASILRRALARAVRQSR
jgi:hypothetical protein